MHKSYFQTPRMRFVSLLLAFVSLTLPPLSGNPVSPATPAPILPEEAAAIRIRFALDEPWNSLSNAPAQVRRHRGLVALLMAGLDPETASFEPIPLPSPARSETLLRELFRGHDLLAEKRNEFGWAVYSRADQSGQPLVLSIPRDYSPRKKYPLIINLHGLGQRPIPHPEAIADEPVIRALPWGRGDAGYRGLGGQDVWDAIEAVQAWYSIDPQRILLQGFSMGGHGAWSLGARRPYQFAAIGTVSGWPQPALLGNHREGPLFLLHGGADVIVPVIFSRFAQAVLAPVNPLFEYRELPDTGHGLRSLYNSQVDQWLLAKPPVGVRPRHFKIETPADLALPGLTGLAFEQPHQPAWIELESISDAQPSPRLSTRNLLKVRLDSPARTFILDRQTLTAPPSGSSVWIRQDSSWIPDPPHPGQPRDYRAGAAANLFEGEPLRIVIPSGGTAAQNQKWAEQARVLSHFTGAGRPMAAGAIPIRTDRELTDLERRQCNLILIGSPRNHFEIRRVLPHLPITLSERDEWIFSGAPPYPRTENGLLFFHYNPLHPDRWLYLIIPPTQAGRADQWLREPARLLVGADGLNRLNQPDLVITSPERGDRMWRRSLGFRRPGR